MISENYSCATFATKWNILELIANGSPANFAKKRNQDTTLGTATKVPRIGTTPPHPPLEVLAAENLLLDAPHPK